jgi:peptide/nickel transport system substrate-binding protein
MTKIVFLERKAITKIQATVVALIIVVAAIIGVAYYWSRPTLTPPEEYTTLTFATNQDLDNIDPHVTTRNVEMRIAYVLYDGLVNFGKDPEKVDPMLATRWEASEDGLEWTFYLREDVKFEDGSPFNASVVKFSFERLLKIGAGPSDPYTVIDHIDVVSTYTVKFILKEAFAPFLSTLAAPFARIVPPSVLKHEVGNDLGQAWLSRNSLGSGPFRLGSWVLGERLVLIRNDNYWGPKPKLEEVTVRIIVESSSLRMELEAGTIDVAEGVTFEDVDKMKENKDITVFETPGVHITYLYVNTQKAPFNDVRVRKAIAYAIDYDAIVKGPMKGYAKPFQGPIPEGMWGRPDLPLYERDLDKAKSLLAEAGYPNGFSTTLTISPLREWPDVAVLIQRNLAEIGITVSIEQYSWPTYVDMMLGGKIDFGIIGITPDYPDPDDFCRLTVLSTSALNVAFWQNKEVDALINQGVTLTNMEDRVPIYEKIQEIVCEEVPYIWLYQDKFLLPMRSWVKGYYYNICIMPRIPFNDMWIEK